jgi:hypothetical protein
LILLGTDSLTKFLNRAAATPFEWGRFDCLLWLADWIMSQRNVDPASDLRGTYSTMLGAAKIVRDRGGMVRLIDGRVERHGIKRSPVIKRGDVAVVSVGGDGGEHFGNLAGGIIMQGCVAMICEIGVLTPKLSDVPVIASWRV